MSKAAPKIGDHPRDAVGRLLLPERVLYSFWQSVARQSEDECWEWAGSRNEYNYGRFRGAMAHRVSYEIHYGPIPGGQFVRHLCSNRPCVNPNHLATGTQKENLRDMVLAGRQRLSGGRLQQGTKVPTGYRTSHPTTEHDRFWAKVDKSGECWIWMGALNQKNYGLFGVGNGKTASAHRYAYQERFGPIAAGLVLCHNCPGGDNPRCVNPDHMFVGTNRDNTLDLYRKSRQAWQDGNHEYARHIGQRVHTAKLTPEQVIEFAQMYADNAPWKVIDSMFPVDHSCLLRIVRGTNWRHVIPEDLMARVRLRATRGRLKTA